MARIKINLPNRVKFSTVIPVRISDVNYGGHVGNDSILTIMHEVRLQYIRSLGFSGEVSIAGNIGMLVSDVAISYKSESFYGDVIEASVFVDDFNKYGCDIYYQFKNKKTGVEIARGKTGIVCFDYSTKKLTTMPSNFESSLQSLN